MIATHPSLESLRSGDRRWPLSCARPSSRDLDRLREGSFREGDRERDLLSLRPRLGGERDLERERPIPDLENDTSPREDSEGLSVVMLLAPKPCFMMHATNFGRCACLTHTNISHGPTVFSRGLRSSSNREHRTSRKVHYLSDCNDPCIGPTFCIPLQRC